MILTEEEVVLLEDMKEIESIQEEIESYLIEKYGLENLEEGNFFQWLASPLTRFKKHYITRNGDVKYTHKDTKLMKKKENGEELTSAEKKRVKKLESLEKKVRKTLDSKENSEVALRNAKKEEKSKKKDIDSDLRTFNKKKKLNLARDEESDMYALIYGDGMSKRAAKKQIKRKRKDYEKKQRDILSGDRAATTDGERDLVRSRSKIIRDARGYADARFRRGDAKESRNNLKREIENIRDE